MVIACDECVELGKLFVGNSRVSKKENRVTSGSLSKLSLKNEWLGVEFHVKMLVLCLGCDYAYMCMYNVCVSYVLCCDVLFCCYEVLE